MKRKKIIIILFFVITLMFIGVKMVLNEFLDHVNKMTVSNLNLENVENGTYIGEYSLTPVYVKVEVVIYHHKITHITILEHHHGLGSSAESITEDIVKNQSLDVDVVSGATVSSTCILKAVENAIEKEKD